MPRPSKLSPERLAQLEADYNAWNPSDPDSESADQLAGRYGLKKASLYYWKDRNWTQSGKSDRRKDAKRKIVGNDGSESGVVEYLTDELVKARIRIGELEADVAHLQAQLDA